ncbi:class I lanthipeptide [Flavobacterium sp. MMS24-S5]|uniref:class I lanthipeptide n=1 Tax=Flavobacterium sp. MMS24-S5 TaxID=3416605 RepID=UPI003D0682D2
MKKLTQNNKLAFNKAIVTELNENELQDINSGTNDLIISFIITAGYGTWLMVV